MLVTCECLRDFLAATRLMRLLLVRRPFADAILVSHVLLLNRRRCVQCVFTVATFVQPTTVNLSGI